MKGSKVGDTLQLIQNPNANKMSTQPETKANHTNTAAAIYNNDDEDGKGNDKEEDAVAANDSKIDKKLRRIESLEDPNANKMRMQPETENNYAHTIMIHNNDGRRFYVEYTYTSFDPPIIPGEPDEDRRGLPMGIIRIKGNQLEPTYSKRFNNDMRRAYLHRSFEANGEVIRRDAHIIILTQATINGFHNISLDKMTVRNLGSLFIHRV